MIECGLAKYIGLPENPNVENFKKTCERALSQNISLRPISLLTSLLNNQNEVMDMHSRLKLSAFDRDLAIFLVDHRDDIPDKKILKPYKLLVLTCKGKTKNIREFILELFRYRGEVGLVNEFENWKPPYFPVNGSMIKQHVSHPKLIGNVLSKLKEIWVDDDFKLNQEELMRHVPRIVSDIKDMNIRNK